jgi:hypothetical protein
MKYLALLFSLFCVSPSWGAYVLIDKVAVGNPVALGEPPQATAAINTTGANFIICIQTHFASEGTYGGTPTDSKGNTYIPLTNNEQSDVTIRGYIAISPTVGAGHTFSTGAFYASIICSAWSGAHASAPTDQQRADANTPFSDNLRDLATGSITPTQDAELIIAGCGIYDLAGASATINGGFTELAQVDGLATGHLGSFAAYLIQTTATAANPTCSWGQQSAVSAVIYSFKVPAAASTRRPIGALIFP